MTFSRAQMIDAYLAGSRERKKYAKVPDYDAAFRYVDSLQEATCVPPLSPQELLIRDALDARETDEKARGKSYLPKHREFSIQDIYNQLGEIREQLLKSRERELVLAKLVGGFLFRLAHFPPNARPQFLTIDWIESGIQSLNTVFPELTPEE